MIGRRLNHYRIIAELGRGGMGEVYLALDTRLDRRVAVKMLPADLALDPDRRKRFEREARTVASLSHPNILSIHDLGEADGLIYAVMELLEGKTLRDLVRDGVPSWRRSVEYAAAIADGLTAAHGRGIVHRDLKPENIFVTREDVVKILDFGLARSRPLPDQMTEAPTLSSAASGGASGTIGYMAPEQARGEEADARSDLFALGCVLYELLAGRPAFAASTAAERMAAVLRDAPPDLGRAEADLPLELERVVLRCLEKEPARRFQAASDLAFALKNLAVTPREALAKSRDREAQPRIASLAVLPLRDLSGDPEQDFFADGLTEGLIADLAGLGGVRVISRTSAMQYKGVTMPLARIAGELDVDGILEGSVLRSGRRVRVTAELVHAGSDTTVWGRSYERDLDDILALQGEVAKAIAGEVHGTLKPDAKRRLSMTRQVSPEAYDAYLKGRYYWNRRTEETIRRSIDHFNRAIEIDPTWAPAHAGLADAFSILGFYGYLAPKDAFPRAKAAASRALELDGGLEEAHALVAYVDLYHDWDWAKAERGFRQTLEANPNSSEGHRYHANLLTARGRFDEAVEAMSRACRLDPLSLINSAAMGWVHYYRRDYDAAIDALRRTHEFDRNFAMGRLYCGWALLERGDHGPALAELEAATRLAGEVPLTQACLAHGRAVAGDRAGARRALEELAGRRASVYVPSFLLGLVYLALGDSEQALTRFEEAYEERSHWLVFLGVEPRVDRLRGDPRFRDLCGRVGVDQSG